MAQNTMEMKLSNQTIAYTHSFPLVFANNGRLRCTNDIHVSVLTCVQVVPKTSGVPRNFFSGGGVQQIQLRTEDREDGDLGAVAP